MIPVARFNYSAVGLAVTFTDSSTNGPTSWAWDFGDGSVDTTKNPTHTYNGRGFFVVSLTATNSDGTSEAYQISIGITDLDYQPLPMSIMDLIDAYVPEGLLTVGEKSTIIRKWQIYLQPLLDPEIDTTHMFDEFYWPPLANELIAELSALDLIIQAVNNLIITSASESSGSGSGTEPDPGTIKKVKTGPAEVEFMPSTEAHEASSKTVSNLAKPGGALDMLKGQICMISKRLRVFLPICSEINRTKSPINHKPNRGTTDIIVDR